MTNLQESEFWVYRASDQSLVGNLLVTDLRDEFMDVSFFVCSGNLIHAKTSEIERMFRGEYVLKHPGKEENFGDYASVDEVCAAVINHADGPFFLRKDPILPVVD